MKLHRRDIIVAALLAVFPVAVIVCFKITTSWFQMVADDGLSFIAPLLEDSCRQIMSGNIPWWSHHTLCGFPVIGRGCGSLYPPHLLVHIIKSLAGVTTPTFFISIVLHVSLCAVSSYCYLRYIGCRIGTAAVGALGYSMAGPAFGFATNWPRDYSIPFAYLPFAFIFIFFLQNRRTSIGLIAAGGFIGGNILLMAHAQMAFKLLLICSLYLGMRCAKRKLGPAIITCALALLVALAIGAGQIFATLELLGQSLRATSEGIGAWDRTAFSLRPIFFIGVLFPFLQFNWPEEVFESFPGAGLFVGPLAVLGVIACLCYWRRSKLPAGTLLIMAGLYFLLCLGRYFSVESYLGSLPFLNNFRYPIRWSAEFCAITALLSGVGVELLLKHGEDRIANIIYVAFLISLGLVMIVAFSPVYRFKNYYWLISLCWFCFVGLLWFLMRRYPPHYFIWGAVLFTAVGMVVNIPMAKIISPNHAKILWQQPLPVGNNSQERVLFLGTMDPPVGGEGNFTFNLPHYFGGRSVFGYDSLRMEKQDKWKDAIAQGGETEFWHFQDAINAFLQSHLFKTLRVGWVVVRKTQSSLIPKPQPSLIEACENNNDLEKIKDGRWMAIFRNNGFKSPAFFVSELVYDTELQSGTEMGSIDLSRGAWIEPHYRGDMEFGAADDSQVSGFSEEHGNIAFNAEAKNDGFVVVTSTWYPGWEAYIDGVNSPLYRVNSSFIGIPVPAGEHSVELKYEPIIIRLLLYLGIFTYAAVVIILARALFRFKPGSGKALRQ